VSKYGSSVYWDELAGGQLSCCRSDGEEERDDDGHDGDDGESTKERQQPREGGESCTATTTTRPCNPTSPTRMDSNLLEVIKTKGFHVLPPSCRGDVEGGEEHPLSSTAFSNTLKSLTDAGWPPQFLLMYDEIWELLRDTIRDIIGTDDEISSDWEDNVILESDVNVWSLKKDSPPGTYIGGNFINPHRDMSFDACHDDDETPRMLSVWIPLNINGATETNGCMRAIPIEEDDFFYSPLHPRHSMNSDYKDSDAEKMIVQQFGCGIWDPTVIHWGGSYEAGESNEEPRSSLAFTTRLGDKAADFGTVASRIPNSSSVSTTSHEAEETGPMACMVKDCGKGGTARRLQVVAKSLLAYSHHFPGFPFVGFRENMGLSS